MDEHPPKKGTPRLKTPGDPGNSGAQSQWLWGFPRAFQSIFERSSQLYQNQAPGPIQPLINIYHREFIPASFAVHTSPLPLQEWIMIICRSRVLTSVRVLSLTFNFPSVSPLFSNIPAHL